MPSDPASSASASASSASASASASASSPAAGEPTRYRCSACGNLTRFTVTTTRRTSAFHHFTVGGELTVEDEEVLEERVDSVTCRWCGNGAAVVELPADSSSS